MKDAIIRELIRHGRQTYNLRPHVGEWVVRESLNEVMPLAWPWTGGEGDFR